MSAGHAVPGGVILPRDPTLPDAANIIDLPLPATLVLPLTQHRGVPAKPTVSVGETVQVGQRLADADGIISVALHAPANGTIVAIEPRQTLSHDHDPCIVLQTAATTQPDHPEETNYERHAPDVLRQRVADAGIAGLGGAAFPTSVKLAAQVDIRLRTLVLNGAECDPAIGCDDALMQSQAADIVDGARILLHILQVSEGKIAIKADKSRAIAAIRAAVESVDDDRLEVVVVPARYPMGGERQLIQYLSGREVPYDGLPIDVGYLCHNVATACAVRDAVRFGRPLTTRLVCVSGNAVASPANVRTPLGASLADLIDACGGLTGTPGAPVVGGRMMGIPAPDVHVPVTKGTNAVHVDVATSTAVPEARPCIRCGECALACPASLLPQQLHWHASAGDLDALMHSKLTACIECGCCDSVCPSHIPLTRQFQKAKHDVYQRDLDRLAAQHARERYEARNVRLERQQAELEQRRARRRAKATTAPAASRKKDILDAVARAKEARARRQQDHDD